MRVKLPLSRFYSSNMEYIELLSPSNPEKIRGEIERESLQRPGLVLAGEEELFVKGAAQIFGRNEFLYLSKLSMEKRKKILRKFLSLDPPCIVNEEQPLSEDITKLLSESFTPVFKCKKCNCYEKLNDYLHWELSERKTIHGELLGVYGLGILITGESGIGKSEIALELVSRGHMFAADDIVEVFKLPEGGIMGTSPEKIRGFMEIRGLGIINVNEIFGGAVLPFSKIDLILELEEFKKGRERLFLEEGKREILGVEIPARKIPVAAGRNIANIVEVAARLHLLNKSKIHPLRELMENLGESKT